MPVGKFLDPKNDIALKKIFGSENNKDILIHFINDIMSFKGSEQIQDVVFLSPVQDPDIAHKKQSMVDVLCRAHNGVQIIVEMQVSSPKGFEKRAQYYAAKAYSRQLARGQKPKSLYASFKEIIFIAISDYIIFPKKHDYISHHVILDKTTFERDLKDFSFTFIELPKFKVKNIEDLQNLTEKWCYFFCYAENTNVDDVKKFIGEDTIVGQAYNALNQFNWSEAELNAYEYEMMRIWDNKAAEDHGNRKIWKEHKHLSALTGLLSLLTKAIRSRFAFD